jgi:hypothetical protein
MIHAVRDELPLQLVRVFRDCQECLRDLYSTSIDPDDTEELITRIGIAYSNFERFCPATEQTFKHHLVFEIALMVASLGPAAVYFDQYGPERFMAVLLRLAHDRRDPVKGILEMLSVLTAAKKCSDSELRHFLCRFKPGRLLWRRVSNRRKARRKQAAQQHAAKLREGIPTRPTLPDLAKYEDLSLSRLDTADGLLACLRAGHEALDALYARWRVDSKYRSSTGSPTMMAEFRGWVKRSLIREQSLVVRRIRVGMFAPVQSLESSFIW